MITTDIAIVGGGFSGAALAICLGRISGPSTLLIHMRPQAGFGLAYSTQSASHLLNVRAGNMSALTDDPDHFLRWLQTCGNARSAQDFVPRMQYGSYIAALLVETAQACPAHLAMRCGEVVDLARENNGFRLQLADGEVVAASKVVLATGNAPPVQPVGLEQIREGDARYIGDPWAGDGIIKVGASEAVLLLGTGLTAVDTALQLVDQGLVGTITALSRRALLPRPHSDVGPPPALTDLPPPRVNAIQRHLRLQSELIGWHSAVDQLRPHTQLLWQRMALVEKRRFLRHARPWWDVHRHRMAPEVAARFAGLIDQGRLRIAQGRIIDVDPAPGPLQTRWLDRSGAHHQLAADRIINCTGPSSDLASASDPLLSNLRDRGLLRNDALKLGLDTNHLGQIIGSDGKAVPGLFAAGPLTRGTFWEITAVPDIRRQVGALARLLADSYRKSANVSQAAS